MKDYRIRMEQESDYREVEEMIRAAFWNLYEPGCAEHYLAHKIRSHEDFIRELDLVLEVDGRIVGNIMYTRTKLVDAQGKEKPILTFGPVCVRPGFQRRGYGKALIEKSFELAEELGYDTVVIFGSPANYVGCGFKSCRKYNVSLENGVFPTPMLVKVLREDALHGKSWTYYESPAFSVNMEEVEAFDRGFPKWEKKYQPSQEEFYINSRSVVQE